MPLESLLELVETLRSRIQLHGDALRGSEALTRYALIDPLLRELGWDTSDPAMVAPEYSLSGGGRADYALLTDGKPAMMVEAKKLGEDLHDKARDQGILYCIDTGTAYFAISDGARWEIYETHKAVPIDQKRVVEFDLASQPPAGSCLSALALWRASVQSGYVAAGAEPIVEAIEEPVTQPAGVTSPPTIITLPPGDWRLLTTIESGEGKPTEMLFPDGGRAALKNWNSLPTESAIWLSSRDLLNTAHCPVESLGRSKRYLVNTEPVHSDGKAFINQRRIASGLYLELNYNAASLINNAKAIINHVGQDPAQFKVRFD